MATAGVITWRELVCTPPPHVTEQVDHCDHALMLHGAGVSGTAHGCKLHACVRSHVVAAGHAWPPLAAGVTTAICMDCWPPPQRALHGDQVVGHAVMTQSTGHERVAAHAGGAVVGHASVVQFCSRTNSAGAGHA